MPTIYKTPKKRRVYESKKDNVNHQLVYNTSRWRLLRIEYLKNNPFCVECSKDNKMVFAIDVHHITPISSTDEPLEKMKLGFDIFNLKGLCRDCHKKEHSK